MDVGNLQASTSWNPSACQWPGSVFGIATGYGLDGPGIESQWGRDFPHVSSLLYNEYRVFPGGKSGRGVKLTPHPLLVPWS